LSEPICVLLMVLPSFESAVQRGFGDLQCAANFRNWVFLVVEFLCNTRCFAVRVLGLPPLRPLALAAMSPADVRSLIRFLFEKKSYNPSLYG
jgi:hypothetical protein